MMVPGKCDFSRVVFCSLKPKANLTIEMPKLSSPNITSVGFLLEPIGESIAQR